MIISDKILYLRKRSGYTQEELAEALDVSRQSVSKWESAQSIPEIAKIIKMAEIFSVSTDYLLIDEIETLEEKNVSVSVDNIPSVTIEIANDFINKYKRHTKLISLGIFLFIFSAVPAIIGDLFDGQISMVVSGGLSFLLISTAIGVIIYSDSVLDKFKYILDLEFELPHSVYEILKDRKNKDKLFATKVIIISIMVIILSLGLFSINDIFGDYYLLEPFLNITFLTILGLSIATLVYASCIEESYEVLESNSKKIKSKKKIVEGVYWSVVGAIYLGWSFITIDWHITWIIWPIADYLSKTLDLLWLNGEG